MSGTHWVDVKRLFEGALQHPARDRAKWLEACANVPLREEVLGLIACFERADDFLEQPAYLPIHPHDDGRGESASRFHPGDVLARYRLLELLGEGGMGEVYSAHDTRLDRVVVIKVLRADREPRDEWRWRLDREARAVSSLSHPNVCRLYDIGQHGDTDFLVMEHLQGETLAARLEKGPLSLDEALRYGEQIADALVAAHQRGIVHRDLKPANIMLTSSGAKLLDFGIAKAATDGADTPLERSAGTRSLTEPGAVMGTLRYMAPEQIRGDRVDGRTDIFALGAVLFEMVTARPAFDGEDRDQIFEAILQRDTPRVCGRHRDIPRHFDRLVQRCTAKDRSARFQNAADVRRRLGRAGRRRRLRKPMLWTAAAAVAMLALVVGVGRGRLEPFAIDRDEPVTLAVLPFANSSGDVEQDYLSLGLTDQIASQMARLQPERLSVIARGTTERYHQRYSDLSRIGRDLGADYVIDGSTIRVGETVRVRVRLTRGTDGSEVWSATYERNLHEVPLLDAEVARTIAAQVALVLTPEQQARLDRPTQVDAVAYEHYLRGRFFLEKRTEQGLRRALDEFAAATRRDSRYAAAYAGIATTYVLLAYYGYMPSDPAYASARSASTTALGLDPELPDAHVSMASVHSFDSRGSDAERSYREAIRLNPSHALAHQWYANLLMSTERADEAQTHILRARALDPLSIIIQVNVANIFLLSRHYERAIAECRKALEMEENFVTARWVLGRAHKLSGQYASAISEFEYGLRLEPDNVLLRGGLARAYARSGSMQKARQTLAELEGVAARRYVPALELASVYAALNERDNAFAMLDRAVQERNDLIGFLTVDPAYDSLRGDPRFDQVLRAIRLQ